MTIQHSKMHGEQQLLPRGCQPASWAEEFVCSLTSPIFAAAAKSPLICSPLPGDSTYNGNALWICLVYTQLQCARLYIFDMTGAALCLLHIKTDCETDKMRGTFGV